MSATNQTPASLIAVTGASGHLGRLVIEALLARNLPANRIVAVVRDSQRVADFASRGVQVRSADYTQKDSLETAFEGVERLLLVSSNEVGQRLPQHENVANAARNAGVGFLAYTSILKADASGMQLAADHKATEQIIRDSGIAFAFLRNSWYFENYTDQLPSILQHEAIFGSAGDGRVSAASRADYAAAAAAVLTDSNHENKVYELGGDEAFTLTELAAEISKQTEREIVYRDLPVEQYAQAIIGFGFPEPVARILGDADLGLKRGDLLTGSGDLRRLTSRPTTSLAEAVASALKKQNIKNKAAGEKYMSSNQEFLQNLYDAFNKREIETIISLMRPDVKWANGLEGGFVYGRDAVREYWTNQFKAIQPELETLKFETDENNRNVVTVHQVIKDLQGNVLTGATVHQIFTIEDGLISLYEIGETETIQEMIQKTKTGNDQ